jgi:hypothetical protein
MILQVNRLNSARPIRPFKAGRAPRLVIATALLSVMLTTGGSVAAANAAIGQWATLVSRDGRNTLTAFATPTGGAVWVGGTVVVRSGCVTVSEQGYNRSGGYGAWKQVLNTCSNAGFHFTVSDYYTDSIAIRISDNAGNISTHVWH